ncbi:hypothetical protein TWF696_006199 [Orbilia brochopaga]|uniref:Phosphatidylglycerol lysyltransferase C-terminal domain-containing protein n=1 Tax=Orbilia brochopaga TaxID=3140254 RepID=A0AAV9UYV8_9PEZI
MLATTTHTIETLDTLPLKLDSSTLEIRFRLSKNTTELHATESKRYPEHDPVVLSETWTDARAHAPTETPPDGSLSTFTASTLTVDEVPMITADLESEKDSNKEKKQKKKKQASTAPSGNAKPKNQKKTLAQQISDGMAENLLERSRRAHGRMDLVDRLLHPGLLAGPQKDNETLHSQTESSIQSQSSATSAPAFEPYAIRSPTAPQKYRRKGIGAIFTLEDFEAMDALEGLFVRYGTVSHMGILDKSYSFFVNKARDGGLYFKVHNRVAIVGGDPLCEPTHDRYTALLKEFRSYLKQFRYKMAFMGASDTFMKYACEQKWTSMQFGVERVLNPLTNPIVLENSGTGKRLLAQNRQLLNPDKLGITLDVYVPSVQGRDAALEQELTGVYDAWRNQRDTTKTQAKAAQAFITVYSPFVIPQLMVYIYSRGPDGVANGFAALRKVGGSSDGGYHLDPCVATPSAPRGVTDLLVFASMALLNRASIDYLSFGFEPLSELGLVSGIKREQLVRTVFRHTSQRLPITGKKGYHDKFRPDDNKGSGLHLIFPSGLGPSCMLAMAHMANISVRKVIMSEIKLWRASKSVASISKKDSTKDSTEGEPAP